MSILPSKTPGINVQDKYFTELERLSRCVSTPLTLTQRFHTRWFFESNEGQYDTVRSNEGYTTTRMKTFDARYPQNQIFNKAQLARYILSYKEITSGKKIVLGPHMLMGDDENNSKLFGNHGIEKKLNSIYLEDALSKIILYRVAESIYTSLPDNHDMAGITVPYAISLLNHLTSNQLDLYRIWKAQDLSGPLKSLLAVLMTEVEKFMIENASGTSIHEVAEKEETWISLKKTGFSFDVNSISDDLSGKKHQVKRIPVATEVLDAIQIKEQDDKLKAIPSPIWKKIEDFGYKTKALSEYEMKIAYAIAGKVRNNIAFLDNERETGLKILGIVIEQAKDLLAEAEALTEKKKENTPKINVSIELISKVVKWDKKNKRLKNIEYTFLSNLAEGISPFTENNKVVATWNIEKAFRYGFTE